jgi:hypothetical protein
MAAYVVDVCSNCGNLRSVCGDPETTWYPQRSYCYSTAIRDFTWRQVHEKHGHPDPKKSDDLHISDGMALWASEHNLSPDDDFI